MRSGPRTAARKPGKVVDLCGLDQLAPASTELAMSSGLRQARAVFPTGPEPMMMVWRTWNSFY